MISRRTALVLMSAGAIVPKVALASKPEEIMWDALLPEGVPYSEIIDDGDWDEVNDTWSPIYDANGIKLNENLNGAYIKMPGFIIALETGAEGVTEFMLVPYVGACIHTPPPPANQLVVVSTAKPWPSDKLWDPVWVTGTMSTKLQSTSLGQTGYSIEADDMEVYEW